MEKMQFKNFLFPHNPADITISRPGRHAVFFCPGYGEIIQPLGPGAKEIRCTGSFFASTSAQTATIAADFEAKTAGSSPGILLLPGLGSMEAVLVEVRWQAAGDGREIPYTMRFLQAEVRE